MFAGVSAGGAAVRGSNGASRRKILRLPALSTFGSLDPQSRALHRPRANASSDRRSDRASDAAPLYRKCTSTGH